MTIKRFSTVITADATVHLPEDAAEILAVALTSESDATTALTITDALGRTIATFASADYTTRTLRYRGALETTVFDTGGDASADLEGTSSGIVAESPLTLNETNHDGTGLLVEIFYRPLFKTDLQLDTTNPDRVLTLPEGEGFALIKAVAVVTSADVASEVVVTDAASKTIATFAAADYTTKVFQHIAPLETDVFDSGEDASANTEGNTIGVFAQGALTANSTNLGSGTMTVSFYYEV